jgi:hypothetical protein
MEQGRRPLAPETDQLAGLDLIDPVEAFVTNENGELVAEVSVVAPAFDVGTSFGAERAVIATVQDEVGPGPVRVAGALVEKIVSEGEAKRTALEAEADAMARMPDEEFQGELFRAGLVDGVQEAAVDDRTGSFPEVDTATEGPVTTTDETEAALFDSTQEDEEATARLANIEEAELVMRGVVNADGAEGTAELAERLNLQAELLGDLALLAADSVDISELTDDAETADVVDEGAEEPTLLVEERTPDDELEYLIPETTEDRLGGFVMVRAVEMSGDGTFAESLWDSGREFTTVALYALAAFRQRQELQTDVALVA